MITRGRRLLVDHLNLSGCWQASDPNARVRENECCPDPKIEFNLRKIDMRILLQFVLGLSKFEFR